MCMCRLEGGSLSLLLYVKHVVLISTGHSSFTQKSVSISRFIKWCTGKGQNDSAVHQQATSKFHNTLPNKETWLYEMREQDTSKSGFSVTICASVREIMFLCQSTQIQTDTHLIWQRSWWVRRSRSSCIAPTTGSCSSDWGCGCAGVAAHWRWCTARHTGKRGADNENNLPPDRSTAI